MADKQHRERIEELRKDIETGVKELRNSAHGSATSISWDVSTNAAGTTSC